MKKGKLLALPTVAWLLIFFLIPLVFVLGFAFMQRGAYGTVEMQFTLENIFRVFDPLYLGTLWETVKIAVITTVICLLIGYPFAYTITIVDRKYRSILLLLATIPFWINFLVRSYAWIVILRSQGLVNTLLLKLGIISEPLNLLYNTPSVILGMVYSLLPFMILPVYAAIEQLDKRKLEAAYDLGATPIKAFWNITVPMTMSGIATGSILVFVSSIGMFVVSDVMGGSKVALIGNVIQNQFLGARDWPFGSALSIIVVLFSVLLIYLYYRATKVYKYNENGGE
ncbi:MULTISPECIES: spermidine/putrescine ABC transporter permease PotB [Bacillus cereus group]|uniref:Spermidine/putrescine transport system permease protein PotB n=1 Tax=Bacillus thuringiensis Bt18247 TaxID=1423143 RepID=A0A9W3SR50_BACTU|nr:MULTISPECIES: spermidine/putrescine ABC transporter permease PotB [Bacillus cereus group]AOM09991.1 spermidine/putrescine transport system permease protein PotB [Bacillus thuringiensis Bt18247]MBG9526517.1 ABC transporter permease [Bacillus thuringiensis]MBJ8123899.1 spermidine/putrescine ABC transporter permease PotB [Bacillus cereus]MED2876941.1 spermidine/putrescine ABC transporter permease PotB [Bacillus thuringiensis]MYW23517.1 spermidine/putrescine ABC transporter permease PotB [Bacil